MACEVLGYGCEGIGAIGSFLVGASAFGYSIWQTHLTRQHNFLSVKPLLNTWEDRSRHALPQSGQVEVHLKVYLNNIGIGPALIESFDIYVDGCRVEVDGLVKMDEAVSLLFPGGGPSIAYRSYLAKGGALSVNENLMLVHLVFPATALPSEAVLAQMKKRVRLVVKFQSIYQNEMFTYDSQANHRSED